eukprot:TRINITY_DN1896_c0_g1_i1.p1 TRINITY_DN1896_c0_g1~~TRINITY_DN1896_c0_g1_i1.p1  ORF type:complete len:234 (+),score=47.34 TRINITY_DN1896_c0_g1_i1:28-729(+)
MFCPFNKENKESFLSKSVSVSIFLTLFCCVGAVVIFCVKHEPNGFYFPYLSETGIAQQEPSNSFFVTGLLLCATIFIFYYFIIYYYCLHSKLLLYLGIFTCICLSMIGSVPLNPALSFDFHRLVSLIFFISAGIQCFSTYFISKNLVSAFVRKARLVSCIIWCIALVLASITAGFGFTVVPNGVVDNFKHSIGGLIQYLLILPVIILNWSFQYELSQVSLSKNNSDNLEKEVA